MKLKRKVREFVRNFGIDIAKYTADTRGIDSYHDIFQIINCEKPMIFDIGANTGQTINNFKQIFKNCTINSFEPSPSTFEILKKNSDKMENVQIWNSGVGSSISTLLLNENTGSDMSSFLELGNAGWGEIKNKTEVAVTTIDQFCLEQNIEIIDVLKIDTQGYEHEVFKGAVKSMLENKIGLLYFEVTFIDMYKGLPSFSTLYDFAINHGFELIAIYPIKYKNKKAGWTDVLFKHKNYK
jgi:FkbM family methyltransferase